MVVTTVACAGGTGDAEREHVKAYNAAAAAGWTAEELRKIGFAEPDKKARVRRRATRKPAAAATVAGDPTGQVVVDPS